jgi:hypothetical protein
MDMRRFARRPFIEEEELAEATFAKDNENGGAGTGVRLREPQRKCD